MKEYARGAEIDGVDGTSVWRDGADMHFVHPAGSARCSIWWNRVPPHADGPLGVVGHFWAADTKSGCDVLLHAVRALRAEGCHFIVGPMDGNTWRRYRLVIERGPEPPFFLEPDNPDYWTTAFQDAGFEIVERYTSTLILDLAKTDPRYDRVDERLCKARVEVRELAIDDFEAELRSIYRLSRISFSHNVLYTELPEEEFVGQYLPIRDRIKPDLVLVAEWQGEIVGFLFAIPDLAEASRVGQISTVVAKTLAVRPGRDFAGLGMVLTERLHRAAARAGYSRVIHALEHESNRSKNLSEFYGKVMRRYALFGTR